MSTTNPADSSPRRRKSAIPGSSSITSTTTTTPSFLSGFDSAPAYVQNVTRGAQQHGVLGAVRSNHRSFPGDLAGGLGLEVIHPGTLADRRCGCGAELVLSRSSSAGRVAGRPGWQAGWIAVSEDR